jgi:hypothetical protein
VRVPQLDLKGLPSRPLTMTDQGGQRFTCRIPLNPPRDSSSPQSKDGPAASPVRALAEFTVIHLLGIYMEVTIIQCHCLQSLIATPSGSKHGGFGGNLRYSWDR